MNPGKLTHMLTLQKPVRTSDGAGGYVDTHEDVFTDWCSVAPASASNLERRFGDSVQGRASHILELRFYPGVSLQWRAKWEDPYSPDGVPVTHYAELRGIQNKYGLSQEMVLAVEEQIS